MKKQIKLFLLFSSVFVMVYWSSCTPDNVEPPTPVEPTPCTVLYPPMDATVDTSIFYFQWCAIDGATKYRIQAESLIPSSYPYAYDTTVESTSAKSVILLPVSNNPNSTWEWSPFEWGNTYQWRVAPIVNGIQGDWSETYEFKTWDARDKFVGVYSGNKYIYEFDLFGNSYLKENLGTGQVKVEKVEGSNNKIRVTEIGGNNLTQELDNYGELFAWSRTYNVYPNIAAFNEQIDSFTIKFMTNPADSLAWGYYFGGHY